MFAPADADCVHQQLLAAVTVTLCNMATVSGFSAAVMAGATVSVSNKFVVSVSNKFESLNFRCQYCAVASSVKRRKYATPE